MPERRILLVRRRDAGIRIDADVRDARRARCPAGIRGPSKRSGDRKRDHENAKDVGAIGAQHRARQRDHEIGFAELPSITFGAGEDRALPRALAVGPSLREIDFTAAERMLPDKRAVVGIRAPRRHQAALRHRRDLARVLPQTQAAPRGSGAALVGMRAAITGRGCQSWVAGCGLRASGLGRSLEPGAWNLSEATMSEARPGKRDEPSRRSFTKSG